MNSSIDSFLSFKFEYYRQLYQDEINRRQYVSNKIPITVTAVITLFTAYVWIILKFFDKYKNLSTINIEYLYVFGLFVIVGIFVVSSFFGIVFSLFNYKEEINDPIKIDNLVKTNELFLSTYTNEDIINNLIEELSKGYINATINNYVQTNRKIRMMNITYALITISAILIIISFGIIIGM